MLSVQSPEIERLRGPIHIFAGLEFIYFKFIWRFRVSCIDLFARPSAPHLAKYCVAPPALNPRARVAQKQKPYRNSSGLEMER